MADELMTLDDMADGKLDLKTIAIYTSGDENVVNEPRLAPGVNVGSLAALNKHVKDKVDLQIATLPNGRKGYATLANAQAAQSSLQANTIIEVTGDTDSNNGVYLWNGTTLVKSSYDVIKQAIKYGNAYRYASVSTSRTSTYPSTINPVFLRNPDGLPIYDSALKKLYIAQDTVINTREGVISIAESEIDI